MTRLQQPGESNRIVSLDVLRGIAIISMFLVSSNSPVAQLRHGAWMSATFADIVYPMFLFSVGTSMLLAFERSEARGETAADRTRKALWRFTKLFLIGILLLSLSYRTLRFNLGTLQCIAIASCLAFPFIGRSVRTAGALTACLCAAWILEGVLVAPGAGWEERWMKGSTFAEHVDTVILGKPKGMEGIVSTIGATACILLGALWGARVIRGREALLAVEASAAVFLASALMLLPLASSLYVPAVSRLMSPSFVLTSSALIACAYAILHRFVCYVPESRVWRPLAIYGMNPLGAYVFVKLFSTTVMNAGWINAGPLTIPVSKVIVGWLFCLVLYRRGIKISL